MTKRGYELAAWAWLGASVTGCGGWVDLENPRDDGGGGTTTSGGTAGTAGERSVPPEAGTGGTGATPSTGGSGSDELAPFKGILPPRPTLIPEGADGPGVTWNGTAIIETGSLETGALAGTTEYCFRKPQSGSSCDWQSRQPFVWTEADGFVALDGLLPGGVRYYPSAVSEDGKVVVGAFGSDSEPVLGLFRWSEGEGMSTLGEPSIDSAGSPFMSRDGSVVAGIVKATGKSSPAHLQFLWSETDGFQALADDPSWPVNGEIRALSDDGSTIVGQTVGDGSVAFRWTKDGGAELLGTLPGTASCSVTRATADGEAVFGYCQTASQQTGGSFRFRGEDGMVPLVDEAGTCAPRNPAAFSADGEVAFGACADTPLRFLRWLGSSGGVVFPAPAGSWSDNLLNFGADADGDTAFGTLQPPGMGFGEPPNGSRAVRWTAANGIELLEPLAGHQLSSAHAVAGGAGVVIGRSGTANGVASKAMLWDETGALDISSYLTGEGVDLQGFELQSAERIAVRGDAFLIQGITNVGTRAGVWFARIPIER